MIPVSPAIRHQDIPEIKPVQPETDSLIPKWNWWVGFFILWILIPYFAGVSWLCGLGLTVTLATLIIFAFRLGKSIPFLEFTAFWGGVQWVYAPWVCYREFGDNRFFGNMAVPEEYYMQITVPAYLAFVAGIFLFGRKIRQLPVFDLRDARIVMYLCIWGAIGGILLSGVHSSLDSLSVCLRSFLLVAVLIQFYTSDKLIRYLWVLIYVGYVVIQGLYSSMFGEAVAPFLFLFLFLCFRMKVKHHIAFILVGLIVIGGLMCLDIKGEYRLQAPLATRRISGQVNLAARLLTNEIVSMDLSALFTGPTVTNRLNQGALISEVYCYVDNTQLCYYGSTIVDSLLSVVLPQFLFPPKRRAGGGDNMVEMVGYRYMGASMNVSYVGEGYANFGRYGCACFTFFCGVLLGLAFRYTRFLISKWPFVFFFVPAIFGAAWIVEGDFMGLLNSMIKPALLVVVSYYMLRKYLPSVRETMERERQ